MSSIQETLAVYIADDHRLVANGLAAILETFENVKTVQIFGNGEELFKACLSKRPDVVFLDIEMPHWDGFKTLAEIQLAFPSISCIMLSMLNEKKIIERCIQLGALGYINKDCSMEELQSALDASQSKAYFFSKEVSNVLKSRGQITIHDQDFKFVISEREMEILRYLCDGLSPKEIAEKLFLSRRTVETHKNNIMQKFGVSTIGKLISVSIRSNIV